MAITVNNIIERAFQEPGYFRTSRMINLKNVMEWLDGEENFVVKETRITPQIKLNHVEGAVILDNTVEINAIISKEEDTYDSMIAYLVMDMNEFMRELEER